MEPSKRISEQMDAARGLEKEGRLSDAAVIYQKLFNKDQTSRPVLERLLVVYRKLKDYPKELSVLDEALAAIGRRQKDVREKWIRSHPQAASASRSMFRQLEKGGDADLSWGNDPMVGRWVKRRSLVAQRISGKKGKGRKNTKKAKKDGVRGKTEIFHPPLNAAKEKKRQMKEAADTRRKTAV